MVSDKIRWQDHTVDNVMAESGLTDFPDVLMSPPKMRRTSSWFMGSNAALDCAAALRFQSLLSKFAMYYTPVRNLVISAYVSRVAVNSSS